MKNDKKIRNVVKTLNLMCADFIDYVSNLNECSYSDRMIESIIDKAKELEKLHKERFECYKSSSKIKKDHER